jgi:hypothetical protein
MSENNQQIVPHPSTHILAIVSLVLSLMGLVPVLPVVGGIGGIISGTIARREIKERPYQYSGDGLARAGIILGWVCVGLTALVCLLAIAFFAATFITSQTGGPTIVTTVMPQIQVQP